MRGGILPVAAFGFGLAISAFAISNGAAAQSFSIVGLCLGGACAALWIGYRWAESDMKKANGTGRAAHG